MRRASSPAGQPPLAVARERLTPNVYDVVLFVLVVAGFVALAHGAHEIAAAGRCGWSAGRSCSIPPTCRNTRCARRLRMFAAIVASLVFTFVVATLAAKSRKAELVIMPALDILQSVPVLGFLTFTVAFFLRLFPGQRARRRMRGDLRHLHQPGLEHGVQLLPVAAHRAARPRRGHAGISGSRPGCASGGSRRRSPRPA